MFRANGREKVGPEHTRSQRGPSAEMKENGVAEGNLYMMQKNEIDVMRCIAM